MQVPKWYRDGIIEIGILTYAEYVQYIERFTLTVEAVLRCSSTTSTSRGDVPGCTAFSAILTKPHITRTSSPTLPLQPNNLCHSPLKCLFEPLPPPHTLQPLPLQARPLIKSLLLRIPPHVILRKSHRQSSKRRSGINTALCLNLDDAASSRVEFHRRRLVVAVGGLGGGSWVSECFGGGTEDVFYIHEYV